VGERKGGREGGKLTLLELFILYSRIVVVWKEHAFGGN
jgi:hypothetical protein